MVFALRAGAVWVVGRMFAPMRQVGSEIEQLQHAQNGRHDVKKHQIDLGNPQLGDVVDDGHAHNLVPTHIGLHEFEKPEPKRWRSVIGIIGCAGKTVVLVVFWQHAFPAVQGKNGQTNGPNEVVDALVGRDGAMHGIVCGDEQASKKVRLQQDEQEQNRLKAFDGVVQVEGQQGSPQRHDEQGNQHPFATGNLLADVGRSKGKALRHAAENKSTTAAGYESLESMCFFLICSIHLKLMGAIVGHCITRASVSPSFRPF